jgi:hypothetical protein
MTCKLLIFKGAEIAIIGKLDFFDSLCCTLVFGIIPRNATFQTQAQKRIQLRQTAIFYKADPDYGRRTAEGLGLEILEIERLAKMSQEERAKTTA